MGRRYRKLVEFHTRQSEQYLEDVRAEHKKDCVFRQELQKDFERLREYLDHGELIKASEYLRGLEREKLADEDGIRTGNQTVDSVLAVKVKHAQKEDIEVTLKVEVPDQLTLTEEELGILIGNLMDNGIEICRRTKEKRSLRLYIGMKGNLLYFSMVNTAKKRLAKNGKLLLGTRNGVCGPGLKKVREIIEGHGGWVKYDSKDNTFTSEFLVPAAG